MADAADPISLDDDVVQVLDGDGHLLPDLGAPDLSDEELLAIFAQMQFSRALDERATTMHRQGTMGTYPPLAGQEAAQVASTHALADDDWISYQYREHGTVAARGMSHEYLCYWMGHEVGNEWLADRYVFPINISIASHLPHATGLAWASKLSGDDTVVACHFGDGATSEGDFHEALNFAGVFDVPAVFFCNNNQYAISVGCDRQTASATIAQKADAYGIEGICVDGMDPLAVYEVTRQAVERARAGLPTDSPMPTTDERGNGDEEVTGADDGVGGSGADRPVLIEAVMYRLGPHTTVDDPSAYRDDAEVERWRARDPLARMETFLRDRGLLDDDRLEEIRTDAAAEAKQLAERAAEYVGDPDDMFAHVYEAETPRIREGREYLTELRERHGDEELLQDE